MNEVTSTNVMKSKGIIKMPLFLNMTSKDAFTKRSEKASQVRKIILQRDSIHVSRTLAPFVVNILLLIYHALVMSVSRCSKLTLFVEVSPNRLGRKAI